MKKYPCVETTIDITWGPRTIRLWVNVTYKTIPEYPQRPLAVALAQRVKDKLWKGDLTHRELVSWLTKLPYVNAVQVIEGIDTDIRYGTVVYTVPFEDVHG